MNPPVMCDNLDVDDQFHELLFSRFLISGVDGPTNGECFLFLCSCVHTRWFEDVRRFYSSLLRFLTMDANNSLSLSVDIERICSMASTCVCVYMFSFCLLDFEQCMIDFLLLLFIHKYDRRSSLHGTKVNTLMTAALIEYHSERVER